MNIQLLKSVLAGLLDCGIKLVQAEVSPYKWTGSLHA